MKTCPKCKTEYPDDKMFCKTCGLELVKSTSSDYYDYTKYFGILALFIPISNLLWKVMNKIFLLTMGNQGYSNMYESTGYRVSNVIIYAMSYSIPVLIGLKVKNTALKIIVISLSGIFFVLEALSQISRSLNWNDFWFRP